MSPAKLSTEVHLQDSTIMRPTLSTPRPPLCSASRRTSDLRAHITAHDASNVALAEAAAYKRKPAAGSLASLAGSSAAVG